MHIKSFHISGYRSIQEASVSFEPQLTTFVGENNVGKTAIREAVDALVQLGAGQGDHIRSQDRPYGREVPLRFELVVELTEQETNDWLIAPLTKAPNPAANRDVADWLRKRGPNLTLSVTRPGAYAGGVYVVWGDLHFFGQRLGFSEIVLKASAGPWDNVVAVRPFEPPKLQSQFSLGNDLPQVLCAQLVQRLRVFDEFRARAAVGKRSGELESFSGTETASVLLNLKNHTDRRQKGRYQDIVKAFRNFFPRFDLDAVEANPGDGVAEIQFYEEGHEGPLSLQNLSSGVHQILTLVTNLVGRDGLIIFIEHPELHLHPHAIRSVESLIRKSSAVNQVVVITHDPRFIDPESPQGLRRVWLTSEGTKVLGAPKGLSGAQAGQYRTALRDLSKRELIFARCVILVEDESQQNFMLGVAPVLGLDLDASGISVVSVDGENGYRPYFPLLNDLGIPYVALRDKHWGDKRRYPVARFFSFGMELENYQDAHGLAKKREAQRKLLGDGSKARAQRPLAASLSPSDVPELFSELLQASVRLATGEPSK